MYQIFSWIVHQQHDLLKTEKHALNYSLVRGLYEKMNVLFVERLAHSWSDSYMAKQQEVNCTDQTKLGVS